MAKRIAPAPGTVGDAKVRFEQATEALDGDPALPADEARAVLEQAAGLPSRDDVSADRAEALAQLNAALASMAAHVPPDVSGAGPELRAAAKAVATSLVDLHQAQKKLSWLTTVDPGRLDAAKAAIDALKEAREDLPPARRRTVGSLISATGMGLVVGTLGWPAWAYLVPTQLMLLMTADLRVAGIRARRASVAAAEQMAAAGVAGAEGLDRARARVQDWKTAEDRVAACVARVAGARAAWDKVSPGTDPEEVEVVIQRRLAAAPVDPATAQARLLAEMLLDEARRDLARADAVIKVLDQAEHARRSLEWWAAREALPA
jgi:hypothetical protein